MQSTRSRVKHFYSLMFSALLTVSSPRLLSYWFPVRVRAGGLCNDSTIAPGGLGEFRARLAGPGSRGRPDWLPMSGTGQQHRLATAYRCKAGRAHCTKCKKSKEFSASFQPRSVGVMSHNVTKSHPFSSIAPADSERLFGPDIGGGGAHPKVSAEHYQARPERELRHGNNEAHPSSRVGFSGDSSSESGRCARHTCAIFRRQLERPSSARTPIPARTAPGGAGTGLVTSAI